VYACCYVSGLSRSPRSENNARAHATWTASRPDRSSTRPNLFLPAKISTGRDAIARRHDRARRGASWSDRVSEIGELWLQLYICAAEMMKLLATFVGELPRNRTTFFDVALGLGLDMVGFEFVACRECVNHRRRHFGAFLGCKFHVLFSLEQLRSTGQQFISSVKAMS
jgi:hypothetical protein